MGQIPRSIERISSILLARYMPSPVPPSVRRAYHRKNG